MKRLDLLLVDWGLAPTRSKAQSLIHEGAVELQTPQGWQVIERVSFQREGLSKEDIRLKPDASTLRYVSRGGLKLEAALRHLQLDVTGFRVLDIGISTGGFTDCLLQAGATEVCGVDVGHGQLHDSLRSDPRVLNFEGLHVKDIPAVARVMDWLAIGIDLCVADLSFIPLTTQFATISTILPTGTRLLALVKPQFEVGPEHLNRQGVVRDPSRFAEVEAHVLHTLTKCGFSNTEYFPSSLKGQDGNQEFFVFARRRPS